MNAHIRSMGCLLILGALICSGCGATPTPQPTARPTATATPASGAGLANPASVFCIQQGYRLELRTAADGSQHSACLFPDGSECEEWAFFRGECRPGSKTPTASPSPTPTPSQGAAQPKAETWPPGISSARLSRTSWGR